MTPLGAAESGMSDLQQAPERHCKTCKCFAPKKKRSGTGIKRTSADAKWSKMILDRAERRCEFIFDTTLFEQALNRCGKQPAPGGLHAAHCFGRAIKATRLDPDNGLAMCWPHHREIDANRPLKHAIFTWWLGQERFDALAERARGKRGRA